MTALIIPFSARPANRRPSKPMAHAGSVRPMADRPDDVRQQVKQSADRIKTIRLHINAWSLQIAQALFPAPHLLVDAHKFLDTEHFFLTYEGSESEFLSAGIIPPTQRMPGPIRGACRNVEGRGKLSRLGGGRLRLRCSQEIPREDIGAPSMSPLIFREFRFQIGLKLERIEAARRDIERLSNAIQKMSRPGGAS